MVSVSYQKAPLGTSGIRCQPILAARDFSGLVLGDVLGVGMSRTVYACAFDESIVIKQEMADHRFQNVEEWETWRSLQFVDYISKWLAPCVAISEGTVQALHPLPHLEGNARPKPKIHKKH